MKNMKQILIIAVLAITLFGCTKSDKEKITVDELKAEYKIDLVAAWEMQFGAVARSTPNARIPKKPQPNDEITLVEGFFTWNGGSFTTVDDPKFAGVNNQTTITSICNWFFYEGGSAQTLTCGNQLTSGQDMAWYTDWGSNVYRSNLITIP